MCKYTVYICLHTCNDVSLLSQDLLIMLPSHLHCGFVCVRCLTLSERNPRSSGIVRGLANVAGKSPHDIDNIYVYLYTVHDLLMMPSEMCNCRIEQWVREDDSSKTTRFASQKIRKYVCFFLICFQKSKRQSVSSSSSSFSSSSSCSSACSSSSSPSPPSSSFLFTAKEIIQIQRKSLELKHVESVAFKKQWEWPVSSWVVEPILSLTSHCYLPHRRAAVEEEEKDDSAAEECIML